MIDVSGKNTSPDASARDRATAAQEALAQQQTDAQRRAEATRNEGNDSGEEVSTLLEWHAPEYRPQSRETQWYIIIAVSVVVVAVSVLFFANFMAAITISLAIGLLYYLSHRDPEVIRYRITVDGVSLNKYIYTYKDLDAFNVIYEAEGSRLVLIRSKKYLAPLIVMEIADADPVAIRNLLLEFLPEDQSIEEPVPDFWARRLGI